MSPGTFLTEWANQSTCCKQWMQLPAAWPIFQKLGTRWPLLLSPMISPQQLFIKIKRKMVLYIPWEKPGTIFIFLRTRPWAQSRLWGPLMFRHHSNCNWSHRIWEIETWVSPLIWIKKCFNLQTGSRAQIWIIWTLNNQPLVLAISNLSTAMTRASNFKHCKLLLMLVCKRCLYLQGLLKDNNNARNKTSYINQKWIKFSKNLRLGFKTPTK